MCWPSQPQSSPPSSRMTVAVRSTPSVPETASMISARQVEEPKSESRKASVSPLRARPSGEGLGAARERIRPLRRIIIAPVGGRRRIPDRPAGRGRTSRCAQRIVPADGEADLVRLSRRDPDAARERAVLRLLPLRRRARLVIAPLAQAARPSRIPANSGSGCRTIGRASDSRRARRRRRRW